MTLSDFAPECNVNQQSDDAGSISPSDAIPTTGSYADPVAFEGSFVENAGQAGPGAGLFYADGNPMSVAFGQGWMAYDVRACDGASGGSLVRVLYDGANDVLPVGYGPHPHRSNFLLGNDPDVWRTGVRSYNRLSYPGLWNEVDLEFTFAGGELKYAFTIAPCADPGDIRMVYEGDSSVHVEEGTGDLVITTTHGTVRDKAPVAFQEGATGRDHVQCAFRLGPDREVTLVLGDYDRARTLVVDPGVAFSTAFGYLTHGARAVAVDGDTNVYLTGTMPGRVFPTSPGDYDTTLFGNNSTAYVLKMDPSGESLHYATFIGGNNGSGGPYSSSGWKVVVDGTGCAYIGGHTDDPGFPTTAGAYNREHENYYDIFMLKLDPTGSDLLFSTYIGSGGSDGLFDIAIDAEGYSYLAGRAAYGWGFPLTHQSYEPPEEPHPNTDIFFVLKLKPDGSGLRFSTWVCSGTSQQTGGLCVDGEGNIIVAGSTRDRGYFPAFDGAYQSEYGGLSDAFVLKLNADGDTILGSTLIGGSKGDWGYDVCLDDDGAIYVVGETESTNFPTSDGAFNGEYGGGIDGFVAKLDPDLGSLEYSTLLGGSDLERPIGVCVDDSGMAYVTGYTRSTDFPTVTGSWDTMYGGDLDAFLVKVEHDGSALLYSSFVGGGGHDQGMGIALDQYGRVYLSGSTSSTDFPHTPGVFDTPPDPVYPRELYIVKIDPTLTDLRPVSIEGGPTLFSRYRVYDFLVDGNPERRDETPSRARLVLDPGNVSAVIRWDDVDTLRPFTLESGDGHVTIHSDDSDVVRNEDDHTLTLHFRVMFDWTWPHEDVCDARVELTFESARTTDSFVGMDLFTVENDLDLNGTLHGSGEWQGGLEDGDWVRVGEGVTLEGPHVVYEGTSDRYPPGSVCNVTLTDDDGTTVSAPSVEGAPVSLTIMVDMETDLDERLELRLTDLPQGSSATPGRTFDIRVDGSSPTFRDPVPDEEDWHSESRVLVAITIDDLGTSGVDPRRVEYSFSTDGPGGFDDWTSEGLGTVTREGSVDCQTVLELPDGDDNLVRWRAWDLVGNGPSVHGPLGVRVDTRNVTFTDAFPNPDSWQSALGLECGVTITDVEGSGIEVASIRYRVSSANVSGYGPWKDWDEGSLVDARSLTTRVPLAFPESPHSLVQWRASDIAGNGNTTSPHFRVMTDVTAPAFLGFEPGGDEVHNDTEVDCRVLVSDGSLGSGVDLSTLEHRRILSRPPGEATPEDWTDWEPCGLDGVVREGWSSVVVEMAYGIDNRVQFRCRDLAGNGPVVSPEHHLVVDDRSPVVDVVDPGSDEKQDTGSVVVRAVLEDGLSGVDPAGVWYRFGTEGEGSFGQWTHGGNVTGTDTMVINVTLELREGRDNVVQFRADDLAGNTGVSAVARVWVNSPPVAVVSAPEAGSTHIRGDGVRLDAGGTHDPDGEELEYTWYINGSGEPIARGTEARIYLPIGVHTLTLVVVDGPSAEDSASVEVTVEPSPASSTSHGVLLLVLLCIVVVSVVVGYHLRSRREG